MTRRATVFALGAALGACGGGGLENPNSCTLTLGGGMTGTYSADCQLDVFTTKGVPSDVDGPSPPLFGVQVLGGPDPTLNIGVLATPLASASTWSVGHYATGQLSSWSGRVFHNEQPGWSTTYDSIDQPVAIGSLVFDLTTAQSASSDDEVTNYLVHGSLEAVYKPDTQETGPTVTMHVEF